MNREQWIKELKLLEENYKIKLHEGQGYLLKYPLNALSPYHSWFEYTDAYSYKFVENIIKEFDITKENVVLDPFCGSGTTLTVCKENKIPSIGFEADNLGCFLTNGKIISYNKSEISDLERFISTFRELYKEVPEMDITKEYKEMQIIFSEKSLQELLKIRYLINYYIGQRIYYPLLIAYLNILELVSNITKNGNSLKKRRRVSKEDVVGRFLDRLVRIVIDLKTNKLSAITESTLYEESCLKMDLLLKESSVDYVITAPPCLNLIDLCSSNRVELWMGQFVNSQKDIQKIRNKLFHSHMIGCYKKIVKPTYFELLDKFIDTFKTKDSRKLRIPNMLKMYFREADLMLGNLSKIVKYKGKIILALESNIIEGYVIPLDLLLSYIAESNGFKVKEIQIYDYKNTKSNQAKKLTDEEKLFDRKSILVLENIKEEINFMEVD